MLMLIGPVAFTIAPLNTHAVDFSAETIFAEKPVLGSTPLMEHTGEGASSWSVKGRLFPRRLGGLPELGVLHALRRSGTPQFMMRGDGLPLGWVVVAGITEGSTYLDAAGVGQQIDITVTVRRAQAPSASSFFSIMQGLLE